MSRVSSYTRDFGLLPTDRLSFLQPLSVSAGVRDLYGALLNGATLALYDIRSQGVQQLAAWINREGITRLYAVPTAWRSLAEVLSNETFPTVRTVRLGGENVQPRDLDAFTRRFPLGCQFVNGYAATEADTICQYFIKQGAKTVADRVSVGWPVRGVTVDIVGRDGSIVTDEVGEIAVTGDGLALGYWEPVERKIIPLPAGSYATGDLGYRLTDGRIFLTGRRDFLVKLHGYRIDLRELEESVSMLPGIREAAAVLSDTAGGDQQLVVHYVSASAEGPPPESLQRSASAVLPSSTIPLVFSRVESLPRLPGGKVNRNLLLGPIAQPASLPDQQVYRTSTEKQLARIWTTVLGIDGIPREADFRMLGGNSITAMRIINGIALALHLNVSVADFFDHNTLATLARFVDEHLV